MNHWQRLLAEQKRKIPEKREANRRRQQRKREKDGRMQHKILTCLMCAWVFDRRLEKSSLCPQCGSKHISPAGKVYGSSAYGFQYSQTPYKRMQQVKRLIELAREEEV